MSSNHLIIKVHSESHAMPESNFWLGFIIYHTKKNKADISESCISEIEIASLKLSINNRRVEGFYYPIDIRNEFRLQANMMHQYLIEIKDVIEAFNKYDAIRKIDFLIATKNKESILKNNGLGFVDFIFDDYKKKMIVNETVAEKCAVSYTIIEKKNELLWPSTNENIIAINSWQGIDDYIKNQNIVKESKESKKVEKVEKVEKPVADYIRHNLNNKALESTVSDKSSYFYKIIIPLFVLMLWVTYEVSSSNKDKTKVTPNSTESAQVVDEPINHISDATFKPIGVSTNNDFDDSTTIDSPLFTIGDQWVISKSSLFSVEAESQNRSTIKVDHIESDIIDLIIYRDDGFPIKKLFINHNWGVERVESKDMIITYTPALNYYDFPLYKGKKWHQELVKNTNSTVGKERLSVDTKVIVDGYVVGMEKINFNGESVEAMKIETIMSEVESDTSITETKDTVWYLPEAKRSVVTKTEVKNSTGFSSGTLTKVLSYDLP